MMAFLFWISTRHSNTFHFHYKVPSPFGNPIPPIKTFGHHKRLLRLKHHLPSALPLHSYLQVNFIILFFPKNQEIEHEKNNI